ncbi:hypothetical protein M5G07_13060 [Serratia symbiotica]|nr:hypothetical protein [Serratia symbiotica]
MVESGFPYSTLCRHYRFSLWIWWGLMWLTALPAIGFVQALRINYRLWQLEAQQISASEHGWFQSFMREKRWYRWVLTAGLRR